MPGIIPKDTAYVVGGTGGIPDIKGYAMTHTGGQASLPKSGTYAGTVTHESITSTTAYSVFVNPASIQNSTTYAVTSSGLTESAVMDSKSYAALYSFYPPYSAVLNDLSFVERQFPTCVSFGSSGGPGFKTSVFEVDSGLTATEVNWDRIRSRYTAVFDHVPPADIEDVEEFFYGVRGRGTGFRYKDWSDYTIANQNLFVGDGVSNSFQLFKRYNSGGNFFDRIIRKPIATTVRVSLSGVELIINQDFFVNETTGEITFPVAPPENQLGAVIQAEFDVPVRFDTDFLNVSYDDHQQLNISSLPMIEIIT